MRTVHMHDGTHQIVWILKRACEEMEARDCEVVKLIDQRNGRDDRQLLFLPPRGAPNYSRIIGAVKIIRAY